VGRWTNGGEDDNSLHSSTQKCFPFEFHNYLKKVFKDTRQPVSVSSSCIRRIGVHH
jgi:hypothetical protein